MNRIEAIDLRDALQDEADLSGLCLAYDVIESHNSNNDWAVLQTNTDDDCGTDTIWVSPTLSFPTRV